MKLVLAAVCLALIGSPALAQNLDRALLADIEQQMQDVRELELLDPINVSTITLADHREQTRLDLEDYPAEDWEKDRQLLLAFGLIDPDLDLFDTYLDAYGGSFVGYYDPITDEMVLIDFANGGNEELSPLGQVTYAHEIVHALQDQHFDLETLLDDEIDSDASLAFRSLAEGDATTAETDFLLNNRDLALDYIDEVMEIQESGGNPADGLPPFLSASIAFPYRYGFAFVQALYDEGGWDLVNEAYESPPASTEQILHPEMYLDREEPVEIELDDLSSVLGPGWEEVGMDTHGEFLISIILSDGELSENQINRASEGWGGDTYSVMASGDDLAVAWVSEWDSDHDAREFARTIAAREESRLNARADEQDDSVTIEGGDQIVIIELNDDEVVYVLAPTIEEAEDLLRELT